MKRFVFAFRGLAHFFRSDRSAIFHAIAAVAAIALGFYFDISRVDWMFIAGVICLVFAAEIFNSALETACDRITREQDDMIRDAKDLSAAAVLVVSILALIVGFNVFLPYVMMWVQL